MELTRVSDHTVDNLSRSIPDIRKFPVLKTDTEEELCHRWRDHYDIDAAHRLAASHLGVVVTIAWDYRGYGLPLDDLTGEGHLGLMRAICRFDPDRGMSFTTYAVLWVRAAIQEYVLNSWSLVEIGTAASQKTLLVSLRRIRYRLREFDDGPMKCPRIGRTEAKFRVPKLPRLRG